MILLGAATLAAACLQSAAGFGFALVLAPALFALLEPRRAVAVMLVLGLALNLLVLLDRSPRAAVRWRALAPLLVAAAPGLALGALVLALAPRAALQLGVGAAVLAAVAVQLRGWARERSAHDLDQRERAAARALARGARAARGRAEGDACGRLSGAQPGRRARARGRVRSGLARPCRPARSGCSGSWSPVIWPGRGRFGGSTSAPSGRSRSGSSGSLARQASRQACRRSERRADARRRPCTPAEPRANMCSMVVCVLLPRFELIAALGERRALLAQPVALAPEAGREQIVGETSAPAEAFGVVRGMRLGEALARCPELSLVPPDPERVRELWRGTLDALERLGAAVESDRPGQACFEAAGLEGIHGGSLDGVLDATASVLGAGARIGAAPSRLAAYAAALAARPRRRRADPRRRPARAVVGPQAVRSFLSPLPTGLLRTHPELGWLPEQLEQLGIRTLGELAALPSRALAERFGHPGLLALDLAQGRDTPLVPRRPPEPVLERLELPEAASGQQLERALELLLGRVLARPERRGRSLRGVAVSARFVAGGTWRVAITLRCPSADPARIRTALAPRLAELPAPAESLALEVEAFGPPAQDQVRLVEDRGEERRARLGEAVRQVRQAAGPDAALRVLEVDPDSRIPERRAVLAPFPDESGR
jgi:protein ImuB